jgi:hypothetical protein
MSKGYNNEPFPSKKFQEVIAEYLEHGKKKMSTQFENIGGTSICLDESSSLGTLYTFNCKNTYVPLSQELTREKLQFFIDELQKILNYETICTKEELEEYERSNT